MKSELYEEITGHEGHRREKSCEGGADHSEQACMENQVSAIKTH